MNILPNRSEMIFRFDLKYDAPFDLAEEFGIALSNMQGEVLKIAYLTEDKKIFIDRSSAGITSFSEGFSRHHLADYYPENELEIRVFVDAASIEVFIDKGAKVMTDIIFHTSAYNSIAVYSNNGTIKLNKSEIWELKSIW